MLTTNYHWTTNRMSASAHRIAALAEEVAWKTLQTTEASAVPLLQKKASLNIMIQD